MGTLTPMLVGSMIGTLTHDTLISDVNTLLFMAMGVFAVAFVILLFVPIQNPEAKAVEGQVENPLKFKHFILGAIAIFVYVGVEVGIPGTLNFYLSDPVKGAGMDPASAVAIAGFVAGTYWFLMLVGRLISSAISGKVSSRTQLTCVSAVALLLLVLAIFLGNASWVKMPVFTGSGIQGGSFACFSTTDMNLYVAQHAVESTGAYIEDDDESAVKVVTKTRGNSKYINISGIEAGNLLKTVTVNTTVGDIQINSQFLVKTILAYSNNATEVTLAKTIYFYAQAADEYFN